KRDDRHLKKVWLSWNRDDVLRIVGSLLDEGLPFKQFEWPYGEYGSCPYDKALVDGAPAGMSLYSFYSANSRSFMSMGLIREDRATDGAEVTVIWGDADGGASKPMVPLHKATEVRAMISPKFRT